MRHYALILLVAIAPATRADIVRVGPFQGQRSIDVEDFNFLWNPATNYERFLVESGPNAIRGFDDTHLSEAYPLRPTANDPGARGSAYSGKSLSISTTSSRIELRLQRDLNPGGLRTLRFGGWFMLNSQPLTFQFWGRNSENLGTDTISGDTDNLQYQWFGWEAQGVDFAYAHIQHEAPRNQYSNFHVDDFTWDPVPEPASLLALAAGAGALLRKRRK